MSLSGNRPPAPALTGPARDAVRYRGGHLQIIAAAGSGKTEVVSQRVADLLADGLPADSIVAFTFTERAAEELSNRIAHRVENRLGAAALDRLAELFVGTIHAYCFRLLQRRVPRYETYDVLDDNQLTAFLSREAYRLGIRQLDDKNRLFASIAAFLKSVDVAENELLDPATLPDPFGPVLRAYYETLDRYRLLTYGQQVVRAVRELERPELAADIHARLRHLIVDEYQDINPAQERLIKLLTGPQVHLCVVGDDQQAIYQWRGSDVANIVRFPDRYPSVASFGITVNRRSRPQIIEVANGFARTIPERIDKTMAPHRPPGAGTGPDVVVWSAPTEAEEAGGIARMIVDLAGKGARFRDIAVLVRSRAAYPRLVEQLAAHAIPVQPGGRSGLFDQPEAVLLGQTFAWLGDIEWRDRYEPGREITGKALLDDYQRNLAIHIINYAQGAYEGFDGEADFALNAVDLTTVHRAKGLEWPAVFVPSVTSGRFPNTRAGKPQQWLVPRDRFDAARYEGSDGDERRLFYVALTRARDWLSVSRHERVTSRATAPSRYYRELASLEVDRGDIVPPAIEARDDSAGEPILITFSELSAFIECGLAFRLRNLIGFRPRLAPELGYGKAVHHVMRAVADATKASGRVPSEAEIDELLDTSFYLPSAPKPAHRQLKAAARRLVTTYARDYEADLYRVWETERPFELHLDGVTVTGRAGPT